MPAEAPSPARQPPPPRERRRSRLDRHWLRAVGATLVLVGLVAGAIGGGPGFTLSAIGSCALGFGFFYLLFPGGGHFGITVANFLAIYACLFVFFREANFPLATPVASIGGLALPVVGFLGGCVARRRQVLAIIRMQRLRDFNHLPRLTRWLFATLVVGAVSFAVPRLGFGAAGQSLALLLAMSLITLVVIGSLRDVVVLMRDVAAVFESIAARVERLVMPMVAFLTVYALIVVVFGCLYRIADLTSPTPLFVLQGQPFRLDFSDALYYSVATVTTLGFGDIAPAAPLVRALTALEVVAGVLMLLFGFSEIMRARSGGR